MKRKRHFLLPENISHEHLKQAQCSLMYEHVLAKFYNIKLNDDPIPGLSGN